MINLLKAEFYKLIHHRSFWGITFFSFLLGSILLLDSISITKNVLNASLYNTPLLYFLVIVFVAVFIGEDFENHTINCFVNAGHNRKYIFLAKVISYLTASIVILSLPLIIHGLIDIVISTDKNFLVTAFIEKITIILVTICAMAMLPLMCTFIFKSIGKGLAVPMILYFLMIFVLNSDYSKQYSIYIPIWHLRILSIDVIPVPALTIIGIDTFWIILLYVGAYLSFYYSDLK